MLAGTVASNPPIGEVMRSKFLVSLFVCVTGVFAAAGPAAAHGPHHVKLGNGEQQVVANGKNHGVVVRSAGLATFCFDEGPVGTQPPLSGASYGIETAHHGPDVERGGFSDGCFVTTNPVPDRNPAID